MSSPNGIRIDALPASLTPSLSHVVPAMRNGVSERLTIQQIANLTIALITDGSPEALDTLNELAAALGDDENFAATVTTELNARLKRDGSTPMTGDLDMGGYSIVNAATEAGQIAIFAKDSAPSGWLKANGAAVSRTTYSELFAQIGEDWGVGDGSTTFNIPDLRGEFIRVWDDGRGVDSGRVFGSAQAEAVLSHVHAQFGKYLSGTPSHGHFNGGVVGAAEASSPYTGDSGSMGNTLAYGGSETRPRNIALLACVKY